MRAIKVNARPRAGENVVIPLDIVDTLSGDALAAWVYMCGRPPGWTVSVNEVRSRFGWGDFVWRKVSKELRERGLMSIVAAKGKDGRIESRKLLMKETAEK